METVPFICDFRLDVIYIGTVFICQRVDLFFLVFFFFFKNNQDHRKGFGLNITFVPIQKCNKYSKTLVFVQLNRIDHKRITFSDIDGCLLIEKS